MNSRNNDNDQGCRIAKLFWPSITFTESGGSEDRDGRDGHLEGETVQVKYDSAIAKTQNVYHEIYEKTAHNPQQPWRTSVAKAQSYIFTTESGAAYFAFKVSVNTLAIAERGRNLKEIKPNGGDLTSMGFLVPIGEIKPKIEMHRIPKGAAK